MILNGKLVTSGGTQVAVFPSQDLYITQGTNTSYSHTNTKNTDNASRSGMKKIYAPCDLKLYSKQANGSYGIMIYHSVKPVRTARYGDTHITLVMMHDNDTSLYTVGKTYRQGEHIYNEGDADPSGLTTGVHVHYEVALGIQTVRTKGSGANDNYQISNSVYLDDIFYINMTNNIRGNAPVGTFRGDHEYVWETFEGGTTPDPEKKDSDILTLMMSNALPSFMY